MEKDLIQVKLMDDKKIRQLFLEHVQELAGTDKLEVYVDIPDFVRGANFEEDDRDVCAVLSCLLSNIYEKMTLVNYIQFLDGPFIKLDFKEGTKEMRKHNANWLVDYVEGMEDD